MEEQRTFLSDAPPLMTEWELIAADAVRGMRLVPAAEPDQPTTIADVLNGVVGGHPLRRIGDDPTGLRAGWRGDVRLSVVMPAHNEERTIERAVRRLLTQPMPCPVELIVVDDGSTDATFEVLAAIDDDRLRTTRLALNLGKGVAVLTGAAVATGSHLLVFDADLEYHPRDIPRLLGPIITGDADLVYGTRLYGMNTRHPSFRYALGNRVTTLAANVLFDACLTDLHTCLKLIPLPVFRSLTLTERGFGLDSEITAELLRRGLRPYEVPVSYSGRRRAEGKKITWRDGVRCLQVLGAVRFRGYAASGAVDAVGQECGCIDIRTPIVLATAEVAERDRAGGGPSGLSTTPTR